MRLEDALAPYRALVASVDELCGRVTSAYAAQIACRAGCDACCRLGSVLPVEAASLLRAWRQLPEAESAALAAGLTAGDGDFCPLLHEGRCRLYAARPIICRTHGLPLLVDDGHGRRVDRCPLNFTGIDSLPGSAIIDLERLNAALIAVNRQFVATLFLQGEVPERIPLRDLVLYSLLGADDSPAI